MAGTTSAFTATGSSTAITMKSGVARISGTFVGTVQVEIDAMGDNTWTTACDTTGTTFGLTAPGAFKIDNGIACPTRLTCSAYTSGTINAALRG